MSAILIAEPLCCNSMGVKRPAKELDRYTAAVIVKNLLKNDRLPQLNKRLKSVGCNAETQQICNQLTGIEKKIINLARNLENRYSDTLTNRLCQLEEEKHSLTAQLQKVSYPAPKLDMNDLRKVKSTLVKRLIESDDPDVRELLQTYIQEISVSNSGVTIDLQI